MGVSRWNVLDERLDIVARTRWEVFSVRLVAGVVAAILSVQPFGLAWAIGWFAYFAVTEGGGRLISLKANRGPLSPPLRLAYLIVMTLAGLAWSALAVRGWITGETSLRLAALAILVTVLFHTIGFSSRAPTAILTMGLPAAVLWVVLPLGFGGYPLWDTAIIGFACVTSLAYVLAAARATAKNAEALAEAERRATEANEAKSAFLGMVSHEIRTPMNGVLGMARALQNTPLTAMQREYVETIVRSGDGLLSILNDVLDHTKIEAGRMDIEVAPFNLRLVGQQSVQLWSEAATAKNLQLNYEIDPQLPVQVLGDETRVRQIILNLLSNALKFTERGAVTLELRRAARPDGVDGVEILVRDTGPGMSAELVSRLFQPYSQAEASTARKYGGTGLGLSISQTLASMMGGDIRVESEPGKGAAFYVRLPLPPADVAPAATPVRERASGVLPPLRVLVTDDNPINLAVARALLGAAGASVETAAHGAEALERVQTDLFDLLLMDVHMPGMDGIEAVRRIREGVAGPQDIPVIALTADAGPGEEDRLKALGFDALHTKPIQPAELFATIERVLERRYRAQDVA